jgi:hypothetical protein
LRKSKILKNLKNDVKNVLENPLKYSCPAGLPLFCQRDHEAIPERQNFDTKPSAGIPAQMQKKLAAQLPSQLGLEDLT